MTNKRDKLSELCWEIIEDAIPLEECVCDLDHLANRELPSKMGKIEVDMLKIAKKIEKDIQKLLEVLEWKINIVLRQH